MSRIIFLLLVIFNATTAHAGFVGEHTPGPGDGAFDLLRQIFGDVVCVIVNKQCASSASGSIFVAALGPLFGVVFMVGGLVFAYTVLAGVINSARSGKFLGKQWSGFWVPARIVFGAAILIPIPQFAGLSLAQAFVIMLALLGSVPANQSWIAAMNYAKANPLLAGAAQSLPKSDYTDLASTILRNETCMWALAREKAAAGESAQPQVVTDDGDFGFGVTMRTIRWNAEGGNDACGAISFPVNAAENANNLENNAILIADEVRRENAVAVNRLIEQLRPVAQAIASGDAMPFEAQRKEFEAARNQFSRQIRMTALSAYETHEDEIRSAFRQKVIQGGWVYAGSWFWMLADTQGQVNAALKNNFESVELKPPSESIAPSLATAVSDRLARVDTIREVTKAEDDDDDPTSPEALLNSANVKLSQMLLEVVKADGEHPILALKSVGDMALTASSWMLSIGAVIAAIPGMGSPMQFLSSIITAVATILLGIGWTLSQYLPLLPYLIWIFGVFGWVIYVFQAMIAAPLWAVMHLIPEGEGITGQYARPGYLLLFGLILRPILLVLGLVAGFLVLNVMVGLLNETLLMTFAVSGFNSIWDSLGMLIFYTVTVMTISALSFSLIYRIPAGISAWYSAPHADLPAPTAEDAQRELKNAGGSLDHDVGMLRQELRQLLQGRQEPKGNKSGGDVPQLPGPNHSGSMPMDDQLMPEDHTHISNSRATSNGDSGSENDPAKTAPLNDLDSATKKKSSERNKQPKQHNNESVSGDSEDLTGATAKSSERSEQRQNDASHDSLEFMNETKRRPPPLTDPSTLYDNSW